MQFPDALTEQIYLTQPTLHNDRFPVLLHAFFTKNDLYEGGNQPLKSHR